jgi:RNA polymerase sigma-70 factor (ECF subfamily)
MAQSQSSMALDLGDATEQVLLTLARHGEASAFREIMQRNSRRLYRVVRSVLRNEVEAEDVIQETYLKAFANLSEFRGDAQFSTWLTRVALNEALGRRRKERHMVDVESMDEAVRQGDNLVPLFANELASSPEQDVARHDIRRILEHAIDNLPDEFRTVFVMRLIEEMSVEETASSLGLKPETVKTRLFRARGLLRNALEAQLGAGLTGAFPFAGQRCLRIAQAVLNRLQGAKTE